MLVYLVGAYNILGIYTQFRYKDMWMTIVFYNIYKLYSYNLSSSIIYIVVV